MIHNASVEKYRTPVGAVTCGSEMMIRLYDVGQEVNKAEIIMYSESFHREYEMKRKKDCMEEHIKMTSEAGVVWYYFSQIWLIFNSAPVLACNLENSTLLDVELPVTNVPIDPISGATNG